MKSLLTKGLIEITNMEQREIKFRAWNKKTKEMYEGTPTLKDIIKVCHESPFLSNNMEDCLFLQSTGLKDVKGKTIFEGDILKWKYGGKSRGAVVWDVDGWNVENFWAGSQDEPSRAFSENAEFEVIGNIYQNKELLT